MADNHYLPDTMSYDRIHRVLEYYFNPDDGLTESESIGRLQAYIKENPSYGELLRSEFALALEDQSFSWRETLDRHQVEFFNEEAAARDFARKHVLQMIFP